MRHHGKALQPQFADGPAVDRHEVRIGQPRIRKARQQALNRDGDCRAAQNVADAMMGPNGKRQDSLRLAMDVET